MSEDLPPSPSTLTYQQRLKLKEDNPYGYTRLYSTSRTQDVFARLNVDADGRYQRSLTWRPKTHHAWPDYIPCSSSFYSEGNLSGFATNTSRAVYTHTTFKTGHVDFNDRAPIDTMVPQQLRRYRAREPYDYRATIRPDCQTTNQTMRMMGTYESDYQAAKQSGLFIPNGTPGGPAWFHPDVRLTGAAAPPGSLARSLGRPST
ncbi:flagellar associated protein, partial [Haematococcus lacustris]